MGKATHAKGQKKDTERRSWSNWFDFWSKDKKHTKEGKMKESKDDKDEDKHEEGSLKEQDDKKHPKTVKEAHKLGDEILETEQKVLKDKLTKKKLNPKKKQHQKRAKTEEDQAGKTEIDTMDEVAKGGELASKNEEKALEKNEEKILKKVEKAQTAEHATIDETEKSGEEA